MTTGQRDAAPQHESGRRRWYDDLTPVTAEIDCGGQRHHITWRRGRLVLEDHDVLAERTLTAFGSAPPLCIEVLDAWRRMRDTELLHGFLLRDSTIPPAQLAVWRRRHEKDIARATPPPRVAHPRPMDVRREMRQRERLERAQRLWDINLIDALPPALRRSLALSVIVNVQRHWDDAEYREMHGEHLEFALAAIAGALFEQSARRWRRNIKAYARFEIETRLLTPGWHPTCDASLDTGGASAVVSLSPSWFIDVWARGVGVVDGCFVLSRAGRSRDRTSLPVVAVRWERQGRSASRSVPAPAIVTRSPNGDWSLHWCD